MFAHETWVRSQGQEDPLEEGMATHSSLLAWRVTWTEEPSGLQSIESQELGITELLSTHMKCATNQFYCPRSTVSENKYFIFRNDFVINI